MVFLHVIDYPNSQEELQLIGVSADQQHTLDIRRGKTVKKALVIVKKYLPNHSLSSPLKAASLLRNEHIGFTHVSRGGHPTAASAFAVC